VDSIRRLGNDGWVDASKEGRRSDTEERRVEEGCFEVRKRGRTTGIKDSECGVVSSMARDGQVAAGGRRKERRKSVGEFGGRNEGFGGGRAEKRVNGNALCGQAEGEEDGGGLSRSLVRILCATNELSSPVGGSRDGKERENEEKRSVDSHGAAESARMLCCCSAASLECLVHPPLVLLCCSGEKRPPGLRKRGGRRGRRMRS
jgi:hypothetical protein